MASIQDLEESLECPICFIIPQSAPIYQCENGHMICKACHNRLTICPSCRKPLGKIRCMYAERMLEKVSAPCPFAHHGCKVRAVLSAKDQHAANCKFRVVQCPASGCGSRIPLCTTMAHILKDHQRTLTEIQLADDAQTDLTVNIFSSALSESGDFGTNWYFVKYENHHFFLEYHRTHGQGLLFAWMFMDGTSSEAKNFLCQISVVGVDTREKHTFEGHPISMDVPLKDAIESRQGLAFSDVIAKRLLKGRALKFKIKLEKC